MRIEAARLSTRRLKAPRVDLDNLTEIGKREADTRRDQFVVDLLVHVDQYVSQPGRIGKSGCKVGRNQLVTAGQQERVAVTVGDDDRSAKSWVTRSTVT